MPWCWSGPTPEAPSASCIPRKARQTSGLRRGHPLAPQPSSHAAALGGFGAAAKTFFSACYGWREPFRLTQPPLKKR